MSKKIVKIIIISSVIMLVFSILLFFYFKSKNSAIISNSQNQGISEGFPSPFPILEKMEGKNIVSSEDNVSEIKKVFESFLEEANTNKNGGNLNEIYIKDKSGKIVNLSKFTEATGLFINPNLWNILDKNNFSLFYCYPEKEYSTGLGIYFNIQKSDDNYYDNALKFAKEWEKDIIFDTQSIMYPGLKLEKEYLKIQNIKFRNISGGRVAKFSDNQGIARYIFYMVIDDWIFVTNQSDCFDQAWNSLEDQVP
jgi:hypothetical protein